MAAQAGGGAVLVVEADAAERERLGSWLEAAGHQVLTCPGPTEPDYTCVGSRGRTCPLLEDASAVILDMSLASEAVGSGTSAEDLLGLYLLSGRRIVALGSRPGPDVPRQLLRIGRHPTRRGLLDALDRILGTEGRPGSDRP
jgi:hypothetical protein